MISRKAKLRQNATAHLAEGEEIRESVLVRSGYVRQQNHALIATDRNLYAFRLSWPGFSKIAERLMKIPLAETQVEVTSTRVRVAGEFAADEREWQRLPFRDPKPLAAYVNGAG